MEIESTSNDDRVELPTDFAEHVATVGDLDAPPVTLAEWWTALLEQFSETDQTVELADFYSERSTRHEVHVNDRVRYAYCALDALAAAVMETQDIVSVRSIDPVTAVPVTFTVSDDSVEVSPEEALICFGSSLDPEDVEAVGTFAEWSLQDDKDEIRGSVCQYTNSFESEATYEQWASKSGSVTAPLPPANVVPLLQKLPQERKPTQ